MKTQIIFLTLLLFLTFPHSYAQSIRRTKIDSKNIGLRGKVKQVKQDNYVAEEESGKIVQGEKHGNSVTIYNKSGNIIETNLYDRDGRLYKKNIYTYDKAGNKTGQVFYNYGSLFEWDSIKSDKKGTLIEIYGYKADSSFNHKYIYKYNENNNQTECTIYNPDGSLNYKFIYIYDSKNNQIEENGYRSNGSLDPDARKTYLYDSKGNNIEENSYKPDGSLKIRYLIKYDEQGNKIEVKNGDYTGTWEYTYDKNGNWIKCIDFSNGESKHITLREIEYFQ
jgi:YD repeat-containing protein